MQYDLTGFGPKDKKIIRDNQDKPVAELVDLGLSMSAYDKLVALTQQSQQAPQQPSAQETEPIKSAKKKEPDTKAAASQNEPIKPTIVNMAKEFTKTVAPAAIGKAGAKPGQRMVYNRNTGRTVAMAEAIALRLTTQNSNQYQIV